MINPDLIFDSTANSEFLLKNTKIEIDSRIKSLTSSIHIARQELNDFLNKQKAFGQRAQMMEI